VYHCIGLKEHLHDTYFMVKTHGFPHDLHGKNPWLFVLDFPKRRIRHVAARKSPRKSSDLVASVACSANIAAVAAKLMGWSGVRLGQDDVLWKPPGAKIAGFRWKNIEKCHRKWI
jgi:hypothetical protein